MPSAVLQRAASSVIAVVIIFASVLPTSNADTKIQNDASADTASATNAHGYDIKIITLTGTSKQAVDKNIIETSTYVPVKQDEPTVIVEYYTEDDVIAVAKTLHDECRGVKSITEQACVAWTICNRVDNGYWGDTFIEILEYPNAFAYNPNTEVTPELYELAKDVLSRWNQEQNGETNVGRVLPSDYMYFHGDGEHNHFRNAYSGEYTIWDYSWESPYEN